jgi:hypothetical protein
MNVFKPSIRYFRPILMTLEFSQKIFVKIHHVGAKLFHANRQTDITKLKVVLRNFANAPKELIILVIPDTLLT